MEILDRFMIRMNEMVESLNIIKSNNKVKLTKFKHKREETSNINHIL